MGGAIMYKYLAGLFFTLGIMMSQPGYDQWHDVTPWYDKVLIAGLWPATLGYIVGKQWITIGSDIKSLKLPVEKN